MDGRQAHRPNVFLSDGPLVLAARREIDDRQRRTRLSRRSGKKVRQNEPDEVRRRR
jgi:hypothetical protein